MKHASHPKKIASKGDRLNWTPLKDLKPVKLLAWHVKGRVLTTNDLKAKQSGASSIVFVP